jgi:hypothetical protein
MHLSKMKDKTFIAIKHVKEPVIYCCIIRVE